MSARELLYKDIMKFKVTIGTFGDDDSADIKIDGRVVGWLERVKSERFASATSRARVSFVSHYSIMLTDDAADTQLRKHGVDSRAEAKLEVERAFERAWEKLLSEPGKLCCGCSKRLTATEIEACAPDHDEYCAACSEADPAAAAPTPTALAEAAQNVLALHRITVEFSDDDDRHAFNGYTNGRRWNGWECPWFTLEIAEPMFARINYRTRRATVDEAPHGGLWVNEADDLPTEPPYLLTCQPVTTIDGERMLIDCGGWLVFRATTLT